MLKLFVLNFRQPRECTYRIAGKIGEDFNLEVWQNVKKIILAKLNSYALRIRDTNVCNVDIYTVQLLSYVYAHEKWINAWYKYF